MKRYVVGTHQKCLTEALLMSAHNITFYGELRKLLLHFCRKKKKKKNLSRTMSDTILRETVHVHWDFVVYNIPDKMEFSFFF